MSNLDDRNMARWPIEKILEGYDELFKAIAGDWNVTSGIDVTTHTGRVACARRLAEWAEEARGKEVALWRDRYEQLQWVIRNLGNRVTVDKERIAASGFGVLHDTRDELLALEAQCFEPGVWTRAKMQNCTDYGLFEEPAIQYRQMEGKRLIYAVSANLPRATVRVWRGGMDHRSVGGPALVSGDALLSPLVISSNLDFSVDVMSDEPNWRVYVKLHTLRTRR